MNIISTQYTLKYKAFEVYVSGCDGVCGEVCHNRELWDFTLGKNYLEEIDNILFKINDFDNMIENIWVMGGEPLLQNHTELSYMLKVLKETGKKIYLFTRFELVEIPPSILKYCNYVKTGRYIEELTVKNNIFEGIELATSNQSIFKVS
jgi:organic radical activating enzyme